MQCVGTSATMTTEGDAEDQRKEVARTAQTLFGVPVDPVNVIGETLQRITAPAANSAAALHERVADPVPPSDFSAFTTDPLATWIEEVFGFEPGSPTDSPRRRRCPPTLPEAAKQLAAQTGTDERPCAFAIKETLQAGARIVDPSTGRPVFAFRLHQFLSKGDNVYVTLEPPARRHVTSTYQVAAPGNSPDAPDRILVPTAFCRECGQEYLAVTKVDQDGATRYTPRRDNDASGGNDKSGYLFISDDQPWPETQEQALTDGRLPYSWVSYDPATGGPVIDPAKASHLPEPVYVDVTGRESDAEHGTYAAYLPSPFRFCLRCRTSYEQARGSDFAKLAKLSAEGRSSAMSLITASDRANAACDRGPGRQRRASCSRSSTTARTRACRPGTSTTSSRSRSCAARCTGRSPRPKTASPTRSSQGRSPRSSAWPWRTSRRSRTPSTPRRTKRCAP